MLSRSLCSVNMLVLALVLAASSSAAAGPDYGTIHVEGRLDLQLDAVEELVIPDGQCSGELPLEVVGCDGYEPGTGHTLQPAWKLSVEVIDKLKYPKVVFHELARASVYRTADVLGLCPGQALLRVKHSCPFLRSRRALRAPGDPPSAPRVVPPISHYE